MVRQWQDELEAKFGLSFTLIDREYLATLRRERGYTANPWSSGSRFIISHSLMADETYVGGLRDLLGNFRPRALFILHEAAAGSLHRIRRHAALGGEAIGRSARRSAARRPARVLHRRDTAARS
jgi:hypothetical protein